MIRFWDTEVYCMEKSELDRSWLFSYFCQKGHTDDMILVYDAGAYYGYLNYQTLLNAVSSGTNDYIITEKYIHKKNDGQIWEHLHVLLKQLEERGIRKQAFIPVFDEQGQLLYFAYEYEKEPYTFYIDNALSELRERQAEIFLNDIYPRLKSVCIEDCNEWAYVFCDILDMYGIPYFCDGEKWRVLFPQKSAGLKDCGYGMWKLRAEGTESFKRYGSGEFIQSWDWLRTMRQVNRLFLSEKIKNDLKNKGVQAFTMYFPSESKSRSTDEEIRRLHGILPAKRCWEDVIDKTQIEKILGKNVSWEVWEKEQEVRRRNSTDIPVHGKMIETKCFGHGNDHIYIIGSCIAMGTGVLRDEESIGYLLAEKVKEKNYSVQCFMYPFYTCLYYEEIVRGLTLSENDIVILMDELVKGNVLNYESDLPVATLIKERTGDWFWDKPIHATAKGCFEIANAMANWIGPLLEREGCDDPKCLQTGQALLQETEKEKLKDYIDFVKQRQKELRQGQNGAIVMNCNPMTNGHLYLIDHARKSVANLYIFVVQEDKSDFKFEERFAMVKQVTEQFENVIVVPSGEFVLSYATMPLYFEKEEKKEETLDAVHDLTIFGEYVAKELGITKRFVGEELLDPVTRQYNEAMKRILPNYGIEVEEIKRLETDQGIISASAVRKWIKEDNWEAVKKFVPAAVYSRLRLGSGRNNE